MGRPSTLHLYLGKQVGGIIIVKDAGFAKDGIKLIEFKCTICGKHKKATFHNVYRGNYKSCGCIQYGFKSLANGWKGHGEISKSFFQSLRRGAESRNLKFEIDIEYIWKLFIKQNQRCALSGELLKFKSRSIVADGTASLDRIDSTKGYVKGNLQWVTQEINYMKQSLHNRDFLKSVKRIYEYKLK